MIDVLANSEKYLEQKRKCCRGRIGGNLVHEGIQTRKQSEGNDRSAATEMVAQPLAFRTFIRPSCISYDIASFSPTVQEVDFAESLIGDIITT